MEEISSQTSLTLTLSISSNTIHTVQRLTYSSETDKEQQTLPVLQGDQEVPCVLSAPAEMIREIDEHSHFHFGLGVPPEILFPEITQILTSSPGSPFSPCRKRGEKNPLDSLIYLKDSFSFWLALGSQSVTAVLATS